jgi:P4 family phage/plasmid primase-like protien
MSANPHELTILTALPLRVREPAPLLAKTITHDKARSYDSAYLYHVATAQARSVEELARVLRDLTEERSSCVVRGALREGARPTRIERRCRGDKAALEEVPRAWTALDVDELFLPPALEDDPAGAARWVWEQLPAPLAGCACALQWTSGAFVDYRVAAGVQLRKGGGQARCRLWFILDAPVESGAWRAWAREQRAGGLRWIDPSLYSPVQPHYTAAPLFEGRAPVMFDEDRVVVMPGAPLVAVAELLAGHKERVARQAVQREAREAQAVARRAGGGEDAHDFACAQQALERLDPDMGYGEWLAVGMALHSRWPGGDGLGLWETWSRGGGKYQDGDCETRWEGFRGEGVGLGSLFELAKSAGFKMPARDVEGARETRLDVGGEVELGEVPERVRATAGRPAGEARAQAEEVPEGGRDDGDFFEFGAPMDGPPDDLWAGHPAEDGGAAPAGEAGGEGPVGPAGAVRRGGWRVPPLTELGNAERLVYRHGDNLKFAHDAGKWFVWDAGRWRMDTVGLAQELGKEAARALWKQRDSYLQRGGKPLEGEEKVKASEAFKRHWKKGESAASIRNALALAQSSPRLACLSTDFDRDVWLLGAGGQVVDLCSGESRDGQREQLVSKQAACRPAVQAEGVDPCPKWGKFLLDIMGGDAELVAYLQRVVGYTLTGLTDEQCLFFLWGPGSNGKTTFLETLAALLGEYAGACSFESFLAKDASGIRNDLAALQGKRLAYAEEPKQGARLDAGTVKQITGGGKIQARFLFREFFEFQPAHKLFLAANFQPAVDDPSEGFWRRIRLIPFRKQYRTSETQPAHWPAANKALARELREELPGVMRWAIDGALMWRQSGLAEPASLRQEAQAWRDGEDTLGNFLRECCVVAEGARVGSAELYVAYQAFALSNGFHPMNNQRFPQQLEMRLLGQAEKSRSKKGWTWKGLGLLSDRDDQAGEVAS